METKASESSVRGVRRETTASLLNSLPEEVSNLPLWECSQKTSNASGPHWNIVTEPAYTRALFLEYLHLWSVTLTVNKQLLSHSIEKWSQLQVWGWTSGRQLEGDVLCFKIWPNISRALGIRNMNDGWGLAGKDTWVFWYQTTAGHHIVRACVASSNWELET